jgi:ankyrin repeat protein
MPMNWAREMLKAANAGNVARVRELLEENADLVHATDAEGSTPLHCAAWKGHTDVAKALLDYGADVNALDQRTHRGGTPLHAAAHGNQRAVAALLLAHGADPAAANAEGLTPLQETEFHNAASVAKLLQAHTNET